MKPKLASILLVLFLLVASNLSCGFPNRSEDTTNTSASQNQSGDNLPSDQSVEQQLSVETPDNEPANQSEPPLKSELDLGEKFVSEEGGFAFQPIPEYEFEEFFGLATMTAPDADQDLGPILMLIGGLNDEEVTSDEIFNNFMKDAEREDVKILDQKEIFVDGKPGLIADFTGNVDEQQIIGRIVVVAVTPKQQFTIFASAPSDRWEEIESSFDAMIASIQFFQPQEIDFTEDLETQLDDGSSDNE